MSSLIAAAGHHKVIRRHSRLSAMKIFTSDSPPVFPSSFFASKVNYALKLKDSTKFLPSRRLLARPSSRRGPDFSPAGDDGFLGDSRDWSRSIGRSALVEDSYGDDVDYEEEEEEDRSLDLFVKFVQNVYRKIAKRARKALRSILPAIISSKLVGFSVDGVIVLAFLWVLKAFLEVVCTLGTVVFVSILLTRVVWTGVTYLQESHVLGMNGQDDDPRAWTGSRSAT
ncbi:unnamed protein product [Linum trigynum]|uniref:Uncharacterized protein n=1 Tax=Linum trigynum TaxID=586398 RepID=A0AAV2CKT8_9ROSI